MQLTDEQERAIETILERQKQGLDTTLGGYAGCGKTVLCGALPNRFDGRIVFATVARKAAQVLTNRLPDGHSATAVHALTKKSFPDGTEEYHNKTTNTREERVRFVSQIKSDLNADFIVIDEASMLSRRDYDTLKWYGIPILFVGDHGQLPPVEGNFNIMEHPLIRLEKPHRTAEDSGILTLAHDVRNGNFDKYRDYGPEVTITNDPEVIKAWTNTFCALSSDNWQCIAPTNGDVTNFNGQIAKYPGVNTKIICKSNVKFKDHTRINNGDLGRIIEIAEYDKELYKATINFYDRDMVWSGYIYKRQFNFGKNAYYNRQAYAKCCAQNTRPVCVDFAYGLTCHKAQGSEWDNIMILKDQFPNNDRNRWRYTAITRAKKNVLWIL